MSTSKPPSTDTPSIPPSSFPITPYTPSTTNTPFPYHPNDFIRADESSDTDFYSTPRFVTHIDDHAISLLKKYYSENLPKKGRVLDLCSSWVSHFPPELEEAALSGKKKKKTEQTAPLAQDGSQAPEDENLEITGLGMNAPELAANPILSATILQDLNADPAIPASVAPLRATVCVVSIDYLTKPLSVLSSLRDRTVEGGSVHLVISNRCFPTKAVGRWLRIGEGERLKMVGDYLWWSGWREVEIVEVCDGRMKEGEGGGGGGLARLMGMFGGVDPLWVVRAVRVAQDGDTVEGKSEL
ncbi:MAG: hypothetical protein Q9161_006715 [Pseudevernia consocians]